MDPVSHAAIGWGLAKLHTGGPATWWDRYLVAHEAGTHSVIGAAVCGALAAGLVRLRFRQTRYHTLLAASVAGAFSHLITDLLSGATMRAVWPLSEARISNLGVIAMLDPYLLAVSTIAGLAMWGWPLHRTRAARVFLAIVVAALAVKGIARSRADQTYRMHADTEATDGVWMLEPVWASTARWRMLDRTPDAVRVWNVNARTGTVSLSLTMPRADRWHSSDPAITASLDWETVRNFTRVHDYAFATASVQAADRTRVLWSDVRYCESPGVCAIWSGGETDASGDVRLLVVLGDWVQAR